MSTPTEILLWTLGILAAGIITAILLDAWVHRPRPDVEPDYSADVPPHQPGHWF